jgi:hypothetical protein
LTRADWERRVIRKSRGKRGEQVFTETHCRIVPGAPGMSEDTYRMGIVILALLEGRDQAYVPQTAVWDEYQAQARQHGWPRFPGDERLVSGWINRRGVAKATIGGKRGRGGWAGVPSYYLHPGLAQWH